MAAEKKWNLQTFPSSSSLFGTSQSYTITCAGDNVFVNLNQADIILNITVRGLPPSGTYGIIRPSVSWASQVQTTVQFIGPLFVLVKPKYKQRFNLSDPMVQILLIILVMQIEVLLVMF